MLAKLPVLFWIWSTLHCHYSKVPTNSEWETCYDPIYGSNRSVGKLLVLERNTWNHNYWQTYDYRQIKSVMEYWKYDYDRIQTSALNNPYAVKQIDRPNQIP